MISILCVLVEATLTPIQGIIGFFLGLVGIEGPRFVTDILGFFGCNG